MTSYPPLYILRHGQTEWNAEHRIQGGLDSPLTELGKVQARAQHEILARRDLSGFAAWTSPQGRAFHTASIALNGVVPTIQTDPRLTEIGVGAWEGLRRDELVIDRAMDESEESALDLYERAPDGEGFQALRVRCKAFLDELQGPAVIVTHGITSRMLRLVVLDRNISEIAGVEGGQGVVFQLVDGLQTKLSIGA